MSTEECTAELEYVTSIFSRHTPCFIWFSVNSWQCYSSPFSLSNPDITHSVKITTLHRSLLEIFLVGAVISPLWVAKSTLNVWRNQHPLTVAAELMSVQTLITTTFNLAVVSLDRYFSYN